MTPIAMTIGLILLLVAAAAWTGIRARNMHYWLTSYWRGRGERRRRRRMPPRHVYFCIADHHEPFGGTHDEALALERTRRWCAGYRKAIGGHHDSEGRAPRHTYFYPAEEYSVEVVRMIDALCREGLGDLEVHLHHDNDDAANLRKTLLAFAQVLHERHGALRRDPATGQLLYGFVHGNWALDNSRPDGRWCGVDDELSILAETGCRFDMTMPSAPSDTQTRKINSLYFARGRPGCRKSHDDGRDVIVGEWAHPGEILMIQGPLGLNWRAARFGLIPRIETGEISFDARPGAARVALWRELAPSVGGAPEHVFIKAHMHGATERSLRMLFEEGGFDTLWSELERQYRDQQGCQLHYVTAWEMATRIQQLACGRAAAPMRTD
ncbi:MAG: hypothetical protein U1F18_07985 [Steroidobacteraceae bacterium]